MRLLVLVGGVLLLTYAVVKATLGFDFLRWAVPVVQSTAEHYLQELTR